MTTDDVEAENRHDEGSDADDGAVLPIKHQAKQKKEGAEDEAHNSPAPDSRRAGNDRFGFNHVRFKQDIRDRHRKSMVDDRPWNAYAVRGSFVAQTCHCSLRLLCSLARDGESCAAECAQERPPPCVSIFMIHETLGVVSADG